MYEDENLLIMEGYREENKEEIPWKYVNWDRVRHGERLELGITAFDRVIWARGTPINMLRVNQNLRRVAGERERRRRGG